MDEPHVMQRHLAGTQGDDPSFRAIDLDHDLLPACQQVVLGESIAVGDLIELVAAGELNVRCRFRKRSVAVND
jgi:hypothetical protein